MRIILPILGVFGLLVAGAWRYAGGLTPLTVKQESVGPFLLVYQDHTGPYQNVGPVMDRVYDNLTLDGIQTTKGFGLYYDDPKTTPAPNLKSRVGCIIDDPSLFPQEIRSSYQLQDFAAQESLVVHFPYKGMLSVFVGVKKVYPFLQQYMLVNGYATDVPMMEIYDKKNGEILYIAEKKKK